MTSEVELVTYCGIYCGDCLGYTGVVADAADSFLDVLDKYKFYLTARNVFPKELGDYDKLIDMLLFMSELRCHKTCRERTDDEADCVVRNCCKNKDLFACYECGVFEQCESLASVLDGLHVGACLQNLREIKEKGLTSWLREGTRYHYWDEE